LRYITRVFAVIGGFSIQIGCALVVDLGPERTRFIAADVTVGDEASSSSEGGTTDGSTKSDGSSTDGSADLGAVVEVAASWNHACAVFASGALYCWGGNDFGQLGKPPSASDPICEEKNGTKHFCQPTPAPVPNLTDVASVGRGGTDFTCAIKKDGSVWCWGRNHWGQIGALDQECAVPAAGGAFTTPTRCNPTPQLITLPAKAKALYPGPATTCVLLENGDVYCWGFNDGARAGIALENPTATPFDTRKHPPTKVAFPSEVGPIARLTASSGTNTTCATAQNGKVWCWGKAHVGQAGRLPSSVGPAGCNYCSPIPGAVRETDGGALSDAFVSQTGGATCVRRTDQTVWCFGNNGFGELGQGTTDAIQGDGAHWVPAKVPVLPAIVNLVGQYTYLFATDTTGAVWAWGENRYGSLGDGTTEGAACNNGKLACVTTPKKIPALSGMVEIAVGSSSVVARKSDGTVWAWGANTQGQLGHAPKTGGDIALCSDDLACNPTPSKVPLPTK
jgi:alpha-tubulin suppressor-like RCC1 family protein